MPQVMPEEEGLDPMDVAHNRFETALEFANVGIRWCKSCKRKIYILWRQCDGTLRDFTADGAEHAFLECGEDLAEGDRLTKQAAERYRLLRAEHWVNLWGGITVPKGPERRDHDPVVVR